MLLKNCMVFWSLFPLRASDENVRCLYIADMKLEMWKLIRHKFKVGKFEAYIVTEIDTTELNLKQSSDWFLCKRLKLANISNVKTWFLINFSSNSRDLLYGFQ